MDRRGDLARQILATLAEGGTVSAQDAMQPRNWALSPQDSMLGLAEIAQRILSEDERD